MKFGKPITRRNNVDYCECGSEKRTSAKQCFDCYNKQFDTSTKRMAVRGPLPKKGQVAVYLLRNSENICFYVGSTKDPRARLLKHKEKFSKDTTMIVVKIVDERYRWVEEVLAMASYKDFINQMPTPGVKLD